MNERMGEHARGIVALVGCVLLVGCGRLPMEGGDDPPEASPDQTSRSSEAVPAGAADVPPADVDTLLLSSTSGIMTGRRLVIRTGTELETAWSAAMGPLVPDEPAPDVDFDTDLVLMVAMGERPSGGYSIDVSSLAVLADTLYTTVEETEPAPSCATTAALTQPVLMIRAPAVADEVVFIEEPSVLDCS